MPARRERARGAGPDRGDPHAGERAGVEPGGREAAVEERVDAVRRREHEPLVARRASGSAKSSGVDRDRRQLDAPRRRASSSRVAQLARLLARPGDDDRAAEQRAALEPRRGRARRRRRRRSRSAPRRRRRRSWPSVARTVRWSGRVPQRTAATGVLGARPPAIRRLGDLGEAARAHEDHERAARPRQRVPVGVGAVLGRVLVPGDDREVRRDAAVGHRDARRTRPRAIALVMPGTTSNGRRRRRAPRPPRRRARTRTGRRP